jgi:hypothetical protein
MTGWELGLQTAGIVFQVVGLVAVAVGIWAAWSENAAPDDNLLTRIVDRPLRFVWVNVLRRRPRPTVVQLGLAEEIELTDAVSVVKIRGLDPNGTTEDQLRQIKSEADQAWMKANEATAGVEQVRKSLDRLAAYVDRQDAAVQTAVKDRARMETVDGIPLAVVGLVATALGTVLQYVAAFLS